MLSTDQSFLPGSHNLSRVSKRFVHDEVNGGTTFVDVEGVKPNEEDWDKMEGWSEEPCKAGTLVLIHGSFNFSELTSDRSPLRGRA